MSKINIIDIDRTAERFDVAKGILDVVWRIVENEEYTKEEAAEH